jgi:hypothetical protein
VYTLLSACAVLLTGGPVAGVDVLVAVRIGPTYTVSELFL